MKFVTWVVVAQCRDCASENLSLDSPLQMDCAFEISQLTFVIWILMGKLDCICLWKCVDFSFFLALIYGLLELYRHFCFSYMCIYIYVYIYIYIYAYMCVCLCLCLSTCSVLFIDFIFFDLLFL